MQHWLNTVNEAHKGTTAINQAVTKSEVLYGREAAQYRLPTDYVQISTVADLLDSLDHYVRDAQAKIEDPLAKSLISKILRTANPARSAQDLRRLAKTANPVQPGSAL